MPIASVPPGAKSILFEVARRQRGELRGKTHGVLVGKAARRKRQRVERAFHRRDDVRVAVTDLVHAVAVEVHDAPALHVLQPNPRGAAQRVEAGRGKRLVQKVLRILGKQLARRRAEVLRLPALPARREVDVALGGQIVQAGVVLHDDGRLCYQGSE